TDTTGELGQPRASGLRGFPLPVLQVFVHVFFESGSDLLHALADVGEVFGSLFQGGAVSGDVVQGILQRFERGYQEVQPVTHQPVDGVRGSEAGYRVGARADEGLAVGHYVAHFGWVEIPVIESVDVV